MFEYDVVEPVLPGNHIKDWQKIRKKQWKYVKYSLEFYNFMSISSYNTKAIKNEIFLADGHPDEVDHDSWFHYAKFFGDWGPKPLLGFFLCSDQSQEAWDKIWESTINGNGRSSYDMVRDHFLRSCGATLDDSPEATAFGRYGGLEQRMLPYFVRSDVYTDDTFTIGHESFRKIPWKDPYITFETILVQISSTLTQSNAMSQHGWSQWLHGLLVSCFSYDLEKNKYYSFEDMSEVLSELLNDLRPALRDNAEDNIRANYLKSARLLITILEDEGTPQWLRKIWADVRDGKVSV
jgi:hypothetical protein